MSGDLATVLAEEREIMEWWAPHYDTAILSNAYVYRLERAAFARWVGETIREAGADPRALALLDAGCGTGALDELLAQEGFAQLTGLDLAERMLREARARDVAGARWVRGTIEDPPFPNSSFDVIVACFTVHHLLDPGAFFRMVDSTLRPGGWFFVLEYDGSGGATGGGWRQQVMRLAGDWTRAAFARKNRRVLAGLPSVDRRFNRAHRLLSRHELVAALERPEWYELRSKSRGVLLPALLPVLVEESGLDRALARAVGSLDRRLSPRTGGLFQWLAGRQVAKLPARVDHGSTASGELVFDPPAQRSAR